MGREEEEERFKKRKVKATGTREHTSHKRAVSLRAWRQSISCTSKMKLPN